MEVVDEFLDRLELVGNAFLLSSIDMLLFWLFQLNSVVGSIKHTRVPVSLATRTTDSTFSWFTV